MCPVASLLAAKVNVQLAVPEVTFVKVWLPAENDVPFHHLVVPVSSIATLALATAEPEFVVAVPVMVPVQLVP